MMGDWHSQTFTFVRGEGRERLAAKSALDMSELKPQTLGTKVQHPTRSPFLKNGSSYKKKYTHLVEV
jgi:hypothetical protein